VGCIFASKYERRLISANRGNRMEEEEEEEEEEQQQKHAAWRGIS